MRVSEGLSGCRRAGSRVRVAPVSRHSGRCVFPQPPSCRLFSRWCSHPVPSQEAVSPSDLNQNMRRSRSGLSGAGSCRVAAASPARLVGDGHSNPPSAFPGWQPGGSGEVEAHRARALPVASLRFRYGGHRVVGQVASPLPRRRHVRC